MRRRKCATLLAAVLAAGLLPAAMAVAADGPSQQPPSSGERWDDGPAFAGGPLELAQREPGDFGPPGPPPRGDDDRPPPPRRGPGPGGDHRPPPFGHEGRMGPDHHPPLPPFSYGNLESIKEIDPEMYKVLKEDRKLDVRTRELVIQYRRAPSDAA